MKEITSQYELTNHILDQFVNNDMGPFAKHVLVAISRHCNPENDWKAWPSGKRIEEITMFSESSVFRGLKILKDSKIIEYKKGVHNKPNTYYINLSTLNNFTEEKAEYAQKRVNKSVDTPPKKEYIPHKPSSIVHKANVLLEDFEEQCPF